MSLNKYGGEDDSYEKEKAEQVEHVDTIDAEKGHLQDASELSGIEDTAASKAAWLISITVSIGGLLFGMSFVYSQEARTNNFLRRVRHRLYLLGTRDDWNVPRSYFELQ